MGKYLPGGERTEIFVWAGMVRNGIWIERNGFRVSASIAYSKIKSLDEMAMPQNMMPKTLKRGKFQRS